MGAEIACQVRINLENDIIVPIRQFASDNVSLKRQWARSLVKAVPNTPESLATRKSIRPLDFVLHLDGSITEVESGNDKGRNTSGNDFVDEISGEESEKSADDTHFERNTYPSHYRLPDDVVGGLPLQEQIGRKELFAAGCLMYEILDGEPPLAALDANEAQAKFARGELPDPTLTDEDVGMLILSAWNVDFFRYAQEKTTSGSPELNNASILSRFKTHVFENPKLFALQASGAALGLISFAAFPLLSVVGFGTLGPVAGSAAAAWQSSIGVVGAGSLFALCQSAAMGGAVAGTITSVAWAGLGIAGLATVADVTVLKQWATMAEKGDDVMAVFRRVWREGEKAKEGRERIERN